MKVIVLGAGVLGVTSAWYLAKAGHEVTVIDRQDGPALETSFANAGEISPGYSSPWAAPGIPLKAMKWMFQRHAPLVLQPKLDWQRLSWMARMLANCTSGAYAVNKSRMVRLAEYSRDCLIELRADTGIKYDARTQGTLQLFRTQKQLDGTGKDIDVLKQYGVPFELLDVAGFVKVEPALSLVKEKFVGALRLPGDETGDCFKFTQGIAAMAEALGVKFRYGETLLRITSQGERATGVVTDKGEHKADAYLVALGSFSAQALRPLGVHIPVYPVKGYSITVPITDANCAPESTIMDETHKVAVTRLGDRIRVGGTAELAGYSLNLRESRRDTLNHVVTDLFPRGGDISKAEFWCGLRPMTPDGTPVLGGTPYPNLHVATGHGTLGWTMAAGTGRVVADMLSNREPEIDIGGLTLARYTRGMIGFSGFSGYRSVA